MEYNAEQANGEQDAQKVTPLRRTLLPGTPLWLSTQRQALSRQSQPQCKQQRGTVPSGPYIQGRHLSRYNHKFSIPKAQARQTPLTPLLVQKRTLHIAQGREESEGRWEEVQGTGSQSRPT